MEHGSDDRERALDVLRSSELGATAVEYALLIALIAAVIIATVTLLGVPVRDLYEVTW
jgi:pilus assembly protein Flp/PilA